MRRKSIVVLGAIMLVAILAALPLMAACEKEPEITYQWKIGHLLPEVAPCGAAMTEFAQLVEERTDGQITMDTYFVQQLGHWMDEFDSIARGTQEMGFIPASPRYDQFQACFVQFAISSWDQFRELTAEGGPLWNYVEEGMEELGVKLLAFYCVGFEGVSGMKGPIVHPDDIRDLGIKVRVGYPTSAVYWASLGPVVSIDMAEVYTALQLGTVDVQADQAVETCYTQFKDVTKYFTDINSMAAFGCVEINLELWDSLTPELQRILKDTAQEVCAKGTDLSEQGEDDYYQLFEDEGTVVTRLTDAQRAEWVAIARAPGGQWDQLREELGDVGDEVIDFLLEITE